MPTIRNHTKRPSAALFAALALAFHLLAAPCFAADDPTAPPPPSASAPAAPATPEAAASAAPAQTPPAGAPAAGEARIIRYPGIEVDLGKREIRIEATVSEELNWGEPLLEFALMNGREKGYETLFITDSNPAQIHLGMILLGLRPAPLPKKMIDQPGRPEKFPPAMPPLIEVFVRWQTDGGLKTAPLEDLLVQRKDRARPKGLLFAFTGSQMVDYEGKPTLAAALSGYIVTVLYNPVSILNLAWYEASPYNDDISGYSVDVNKLPPEMVRIRKMEINNKGMVDQIVTKSLPVTVILRPLDGRAADK